MRVILKNHMNCELDGWNSAEEFAQAILTDKVVIYAGDKVEFESTAEDALDDFNYVGSRHHY